VTAILALLAAVLGLAVAGYASWRLGVAERDALEQRTAGTDPEVGLDALTDAWDAAVRRTRPGRWLQARLVRAGLTWRVSTAWLALIGIVLFGFLLANRYMSWWIAVLVAIGLGRAALLYLDRREQQRREAFIAQLPEMARLLSNATSAGLALRAAIAMAAEDLAAPAGPELHRVSQRIAVGTPTSQALDELHDRLPSRELSLLTRTLIIQARAGGAVVTALREMSQTLEARKELRREVRTVLSGAIYTSWVVLILGVGAVLMMNGIAPGTLDRMTSTVVGQLTLALAGALYAIGFLLIRRTTRIEV
jgi:tight adherence protein B